ncbi:MAG TPA: acetyl-CoA carboxylase carboxyl transferase subunit alpha/beta, partial [Thermodesulfatator atlanticus]|nr:acetyl-CoA carboxylase carboxyl transferase subunit alpha/beta [Thermodesulfatator atlanticus]
MRELQRYLHDLIDRVIYLQDIKGENWQGCALLLDELQKLKEDFYQISEAKCQERLESLENRLKILEDRAAAALTPYEIVKITRHPQRFTLLDILENVYDSYTELGGEGDINVDPAVICARAVISRRVGDKVFLHQV